MAPFYHLANALLGAAASESATEAVARVRAAPLAFTEEAEAYAAAAAERAATLVPGGGTVVTYSRSHSVLEALRVGAEGGRLWTVRVSEARPRNEGRSVARNADAVGESRLRNKIGTAALARSARAVGVPAYVVTDPLKLLPERLWIPEEERPAREVWAVRRRRVTVRNLYFEEIPLSLFDGIVLGTGDRDPHPPGDLTRWPAADYFQPLERLLAGG
jgi:translation initiation factor 2B subunit (eIF-2B alpha/beta/delta family)